MRRTALVAVLGATFVVGLVACGDEIPPPQPPPPPPVASAAPPPPPPADPPPAPAPPKKTMAELQAASGQAMGEAFASGDAKKAAALYSENAVLKIAGGPDVSGRAAIETGLGQFFATFAKMKTGASRVFSKGDVVVTEWVMNATHAGDFMGVKATEKPVGWNGASVMWFAEDGTIKEEHLYWNAAVVAPQVGASKDKARAIPALPGQPQVVAAQGTPDDDKNAPIVKQINHTWETKDDKALAQLLGDEVVWDDLTMPEPAKGKAAVQKYFKTFTVAFPDAKLETAHSWGFGSFVVEEGTYAGTNKGALLGAKATNKTMTIHELNVFEVDKAGKVVHATTYGNDVEMSSQLYPPKAPPAAKAAPAAKPAAKAAPAAKPAPKK